MKKWFAGIFSWSSNFLNTVYWICQSKNDQKCEQNSREWQSMKFEYLELVHHGDSSEILSHLYTKWYASMYSFSMTTLVEHSTYKSQWISKCLFGIVNSPQKMNKKIGLYYYATSSLIVFVHFWKNWRQQKEISKLTNL